jgi:hypothetical protein
VLSVSCEADVVDVFVGETRLVGTARADADWSTSPLSQVVLQLPWALPSLG